MKYTRHILTLLLLTLTLFANIPQNTYDARGNKACHNSFDGQTLVATKQGLIPIEDIKIGDRVWAYNEANQTKSLQEVTHLIRGEGNKTLTDITLQL